MPGIQNIAGIFLAGFGVAWVACFLGCGVRMMFRFLSGSSDGSEPGI
jgi:hypothetical protein